MIRHPAIKALLVCGAFTYLSKYQVGQLWFCIHQLIRSQTYFMPSPPSHRHAVLNQLLSEIVYEIREEGVCTAPYIECEFLGNKSRVTVTFAAGGKINFSKRGEQIIVMDIINQPMTLASYDYQFDSVERYIETTEDGNHILLEES